MSQTLNQPTRFNYLHEVAYMRMPSMIYMRMMSQTLTKPIKDQWLLALNF
jgi:hypothetical protein